MTKKRQPIGKSSLKRGHVKDDLLRKILSGKLQPGDRLPTRARMEKEYEVSTITVQRALDQLVEDGFVRAHVPTGTFVTDNPPHLCRFGLVFEPQAGKAVDWDSFCTAMANAAAHHRSAAAVRLEAYTGVGWNPVLNDYVRLQEDVQHHRLAGLIFVFPPHALQGTPMLDQPDLGRVVIMERPLLGIPSAVNLDGALFLYKALDHFAAQGCKRIAVLSGPTDLRREFQEGLRERNMTTQPYWYQPVSIHNPEFAQSCMHLLMHGQGEDRPDGVLITDDNLVPHATAGLIAAGVQPPMDVEVVAHANFPYLTPSVVPCKRLGYDLRQVLHACIECMVLQRTGAAPAVKHVPALFDHEVPERQPMPEALSA